MTKLAEPAQPSPNLTLTFRKSHPKNRCSYGVPGVSGIAVFDLRLFASGKAPKTITVDCNLAVAPTAKGKK